ncbi:MAG: DUF3084 domain-containing protein [Armatimonadetes bacterium]|nr:DUF3084 domain-containing protein [Armatimonadota bacterium]
MAGLSGIFLIVALVVVSGVIAYVGDIVGRRMGRKRLSLFGLRPRHTAIVISVLAGMLITIMTLGVAMLVSQDVKDGFLRVVEMRTKQAELARQLTQLHKSMGELERTRQAAEDELQARRDELEQAKTMLEEASADLESTQEELAKSSQALQNAEEAVQRVGKTFLELARRKDELQRDIENLRAQAAGGITLERSTPVIFGVGQPLDWELIDGGRPVSEIREDLAAFVTQLDERAQNAGAQPLTDGTEAVVIRKPVRDPETEAVVWFSDDQVLDAIAERIHESAGAVIVRAFSVFNSHPGEPVRIDFELFRNHLVFRQGEVLAQAFVDGRQSEPELMAELLKLLREQVNPRARAHNVMPRPSPASASSMMGSEESVGDISIGELFSIVEALRGIGGMARVKAIAAADTWTIGPLEVDLVVSRADTPLRQ